MPLSTSSRSLPRVRRTIDVSIGTGLQGLSFGYSEIADFRIASRWNCGPLADRRLLLRARNLNALECWKLTSVMSCLGVEVTKNWKPAMETKSASSSASSPKPLPGASPSTSLVSERLTKSELESLKQDLKDKSAYLQEVFPKTHVPS